MVNTKRVSVAIISLIVAIMALLCFSQNTIAFAATTYKNLGQVNHYGTNYTDSGIIYVGDSRTYKMLNTTDGKNFGGAAIVGGHFVHTYNVPNDTKHLDYYGSYIPGKFTTAKGKYDGTMAKLKDQALATIKAKGYCHIYFFSTINDVNFQNYNAVEDMISLAAEATNWHATYNNKTKYVKVHVIKLVGTKATPDTSTKVKNWNNKIDKLVNLHLLEEDQPIYVNSINGIVNGSVTKYYNGISGTRGYTKDGIHYTDATTKAINKYIKSISTAY